ncbi:TPA: hypothetical protein N0F65_002512 [Lagenidium giganteum]|uniref:U1 small nuclear ribonucleoprotein 70 kDa n=1 Tax=Lagenidium giganteum TaxID=4803 RepID=A0AAV2YXC1_9STRA|nr:TPA: hypothetical protein N0F65_002512 [Lagenidium giganteum]
MTPKGQMSSSGMGPAITHLPLHLKAMFEPRPPLEHRPPLTTAPPPREISETPKERRERLRAEKMAQNEARMQEDLAKWNPNAADERKTGDAYKTLFVGRISFETTEKQLRLEFEHYGPIKSIRLVEDAEGKSRGYAFIEFEKENDMKAAYKHADGKKIDGRLSDWKPRKFGGGIGDSRKGGADVNVKYSGSNGGGGDRHRPRRDDSHYHQARDRSRDRDRDRDRDYRSRGGDERRERRRSRSRSRDRGDRDRGYDRDRGDRHRDQSRERRGSRDYSRRR